MEDELKAKKSGEPAVVDYEVRTPGVIRPRSMLKLYKHSMLTHIHSAGLLRFVCGVPTFRPPEATRHPVGPTRRLRCDHDHLPARVG